MIDESNINEYVIELTRTKIFARDLKHIVYGEDSNTAVVDNEPGEGSTPYLKYPEENMWLRLVKIENV